MLLKNGHLIDPTTKTNEFMDIRIENGIISKSTGTSIGKSLQCNRRWCSDTDSYWLCQKTQYQRTTS